MMNKILKWLFCIPLVNIDKWGYRYFDRLPEKDKEHVQSLIERGENVFIYADGRYLHLYITDLEPLPGFSGATLTYTND